MSVVCAQPTPVKLYLKPNISPQGLHEYDGYNVSFQLFAALFNSDKKA